MEKGSIARDTMAVCFAAVLFVSLLFGGLLLLSPSDPPPFQGNRVRAAESARLSSPALANVF